MGSVDGDLLYTAQEQNLFLHTPLFFRQQMVVSGGLLTWVGCYLTQYFYYPVLGAVLLGLLWALLLWLLRHAFRLGSTWPGLVPVACLMLTVGTLGYWVYYLKLGGALFAATVGTVVAVAMVWAYRSLPRRWWLRSLFIPLAASVGYPLFGFYGLWGVLMMGLTAWRTDGRTVHHVADSLLAVVAVVTVPLVCYYTVYHETHLAGIYWTALPVFAMHGHSYPAYYLPYVFLVLTVILLALHPSPKSLHPSPKSLHPSPFTLHHIPAIVAAAAVIAFWYKDGNFHRELAMRRCIDTQQWERLLETARRAKGEPTRAMCLMQNLALFRLGRSGTDAFLYPQGARRPDAPFSVRTVHTVGKVLYLHYGIPNYCYRWCMEDGVEYGWTVEKLKLMTLCALINGEPVAAQRFINLLKKTDFNDAWARRYEEYPYRPQLVVDDPGLSPILPLLRSDDFLTADQSQQELFLFEHFLSTAGENAEQQRLTRFASTYYRRNRQPLIEP
jgi:hypothetical protein